MYEPNHFNRLVAAVLDYVLSLMLAVLVALVVVLTPWERTPLGQMLAMGIGMATVMAYFTLWHWRTGQTPGKWLMKLRVVGAYSDRIGLGSAALRTVGFMGPSVIVMAMQVTAEQIDAGNGLLAGVFFASLLSTVYNICNLFMILGDRQRRGLHDVLARTHCVSVKEVAYA